MEHYGFLVMTDSTIAPLKTSDFLLRTFRGCSTRGRMLLTKGRLHIFFVCKGQSNDNVGVSKTPYFRRYDRKLVWKPAISLNNSWGCYRFFVRLFSHPIHYLLLSHYYTPAKKIMCYLYRSTRFFVFVCFPSHSLSPLIALLHSRALHPPQV